MRFEPGQVILHYEIRGRVGQGGMGEVFRAFDTRLQRDVALKVLPDHLARHPEAKARFLVEARAASALEHPNVCVVHAIEETPDGTLLIAMALYSGETLQSTLARGRLPVATALDVAEQLASGLAAAHARGILHRDVKPANVMLTDEGRAVLLDFGLAKVTDLDLTQASTTLGTIAYMSPEQARGEKVDARADVWSLGVVIYEMLAGRRPFAGDGVSVVQSILGEPPLPLQAAAPDLPTGVADVVMRCLVKDRERRMPGMSELVRALQQCRPGPAGAAATSRRTLGLVVGVAVLLLAALTTWFVSRNREQARVRAELLPEMERLLDLARGDSSATPAWQAKQLADEAAAVLGDDPALAAAMARFGASLQIDSEPPGALVRARGYGDENGPWHELGRTPLAAARVPYGLSTIELTLDGHRPVRDILWGVKFFVDQRRYVLDADGAIPDEMVRVTVEPYPVQLPGLDHLEREPLLDFLIDRTEVSNADFQRFVAAGGYTRPEFWREPFVLDGAELSFAEAMARFVDATGQPGPRGWEAGTYPDGQAGLPVGGVSWYEAAAYAAFAEKELPTIFHWSLAAFPIGSSEIVPRANFGDGPVQVGSAGSHNRYGTVDMAGNVREWCANESWPGTRYTLGGGWSDHRYAFNDAYGASAWDRSLINGFRCIRVPVAEPNRERLWRRLDIPFRDFTKEQPVDDATFAMFLRQFTYDRSPLNAVIEDERDEELAVRQVVTFDAAYGGERMRAVVLVPKTAAPPFQVVVLFPGSNAIHSRSSDGWDSSGSMLVKSGRMLVLPIFKGTYERRDELKSDYPDETAFYKDHVIMWAKDLSRTIDYLESRGDVDRERLAYYGTSWGGALGAMMPAVEKRFACNVLLVAGLLFQRSLPEVDAFHYASRVTQPTLMLNGEYDFFFPLETAQKPLFAQLGSPPEHKRYLVYPGAHSVPRTELAKEMLGWLDKYLGPVRR